MLSQRHQKCPRAIICHSFSIMCHPILVTVHAPLATRRPRRGSLCKPLFDGTPCKPRRFERLQADRPDTGYRGGGLTFTPASVMSKLIKSSPACNGPE
jgi:hypothetical protein